MKKRIISIIISTIIIFSISSSTVAIASDPEALQLSSAEVLYTLGLMNGYGVLEDGSIDFALDLTITRQEALSLLIRALGHADEASAMSYSHPFTDVASWADGCVGYAYNSGIAAGVSNTSFNAEGAVTGRDLATFILRAIGYESSFKWETACRASDGLGITHGQFGAGTAPITRGQAADVIKELLSHTFKGENKTILAFLVETGVVSADQVKSAGLTNLLTSVDESALTGAEAFGINRESIFTITAYDLEGGAISTGTGCFIGNGIGVTAFSNLRFCVSADVTTSSGSKFAVSSIRNYDMDNNLIYFSIDTAGNSFFSASNDMQKAGSTVYVLSSAPASGRYTSAGIACVADAGLPAVDCYGNFLGITTSVQGKLADISYENMNITVQELGEFLWPEVYEVFEAEPEYPRGIDPTKPMVALTYDDGPHLTNTPALLDLLQEYNTVATFFEVGSRLETMPQFLSTMEEIGCEIGNHSYSHSNLTRLTSDKVTEEIEKTNALIREEVGHDATVVRAPGGSVNATVKSAINFPLINWTVDTEDWKYRSAEHVISSIKNAGDLDGKIILMHSLYSSTVEASETIIPWLIEQGYQLVTVSELAQYRDVTMVNGTVYFKFNKSV